MTQTYNIYCDESCHLEGDQQNVMVLGAVWCPLEKRREIATRLREIKGKHDLSLDFETKWVKVSPGKARFYLDVMDYFFDDDDLHFRAVIVPDKALLRHEDPARTHDEWYYLLYADMLKAILHPDARYRIYLDYKDTRGAEKVNRLQDVLHNKYDFSQQVIQRIQLVRSHEVEILQVADLLIGTISYANRRLGTSRAKLELVERMGQRSGYCLTQTTLFREEKVNLFIWGAP